jgi:CO dehydrogenase maturation factor
MKLAISGKGGVGKTTLSAMLAGAWALRGHSVIAIDADPDANLASALGVPGEEPITPLAEMKSLIRERTGSESDYGGFFKLNPRVDDIPDRYARRIGTIRLLVLGGIRKGGDGCLCPATALLKALLIHVVLGREEAIIMDMEAGIEHLGRATAQSMDALIVVVDATPWSAQTALRVQKLADDIGVKRVFAVANRIAGKADLEKARGQLGRILLIGHLGVDDRLAAGVVRPAAGGGIEASQSLKDNLPAVEGILAEVNRRL